MIFFTGSNHEGEASYQSDHFSKPKYFSMIYLLPKQGLNHN
jgi:hypothetical protein